MTQVYHLVEEQRDTRDGWDQQPRGVKC
jgi:hypothetical protein